MTLDTIEALECYASLHPAIEAAAEFLASPDLAELPDGRHEIDGDALFAIVMRDQGKRTESAALEAHNRYIDVQALLSGEESIGYRLRANCQSPRGEYDAERDLIFFEDAPSCWLHVCAQQFALFFPHDAHAPMVSDGELHKVVVKIAI